MTHAPAPFFVFSLPRSRSTWLSVFLAGDHAPVGHDIGIGCQTPEEFAGRLETLAGTCETGAAFAAPLIRSMVPAARFAVVWRDPDEVAESLERLGIPGQRDEMHRRAEHLFHVMMMPGVLTTDWSALKKETAANTLYAHCRGEPAPAGHWHRLDPINIQVDMPRHFQALIDNAEKAATLKAEVARRLAKPGLHVALEPWTANLWAEGRALTEAHFEEVDGGVEPKRQFHVDEAIMVALQRAGALKLVTARQDGRLIGYLTWNVSRDPESEGLVIAQQGAWYVAPGHPKAAVRMFDASIELLRECGVRCIFPHHRTQGRGANIGKFFRRRGAKKIQDTYSLWIGD